MPLGNQYFVGDNQPVPGSQNLKDRSIPGEGIQRLVDSQVPERERSWVLKDIHQRWTGIRLAAWQKNRLAAAYNESLEGEGHLSKQRLGAGWCMSPCMVSLELG